jgi:hypothetical protein
LTPPRRRQTPVEIDDNSEFAVWNVDYAFPAPRRELRCITNRRGKNQKRRENAHLPIVRSGTCEASEPVSGKRLKPTAAPLMYHKQLTIDQILLRKF